MIQRNKFMYLRYKINELFNKGTTPIKGSENYKEDVKNQNNLINNREIQTIIEPPSEAIKLFTTSIKYNITMGTATDMGLAKADMVSWYMKPITLNISGISIVTPNLMIDSDNMIPTIYRKLKKYLSESNFNYYQKPKFLLYIENGIPELDSFEGVIKSFSFDEKADYPDKFEFSLEFEGKYMDQDILDKAAMGLAADLKSAATKTVKLSAIMALNSSKKL